MLQPSEAAHHRLLERPLCAGLPEGLPYAVGYLLLKAELRRLEAELRLLRDAQLPPGLAHAVRCLLLEAKLRHLWDTELPELVARHRLAHPRAGVCGAVSGGPDLAHP